MAKRSDAASEAWGPANQSLKMPMAEGATIQFNTLATKSDMAMNMLRIWHGARLLSNPKQGPI
jgi:hypothetical protein